MNNLKYNSNLVILLICVFSTCFVTSVASDTVLSPFEPQNLPIDFSSVLGIPSNPITAARFDFINSLISEAANSVGGGLGGSIGLSSSMTGLSARGFDYIFSPSEGLREIDNMGSLYTEPAWTLGGQAFSWDEEGNWKGKFSLGFTYSHIDFSEYNGKSLNNLFDVYLGNDKILETGYDLQADVYNFSGTLGVFEDLDIGVVVPVISLESESFYQLGASARQSFENDTTGIGDVLFRAKYNIYPGLISKLQPDQSAESAEETGNPDSGFFEEEAEEEPGFAGGLHWSAGFDFKLNSGDEDEYLGTGSRQYRIRNLFSYYIEPVHIYPTLELAYMFDEDDSDFNAFEYRASLPYEIVRSLTLSVEWIGQVSDYADMNDIGLSVLYRPTRESNFFNRFILLAGIRFPLDDNGLRADIYPTVGIEYRF